MDTGIDRVADWWRDGERAAATLIDRLTDDDFVGASRLPGWSRATLIAHLARNADALVNLLSWARTGVETPMYASPDARDADIADGAAQSASDLRADVSAAVRRLSDAVDAMPVSAWTAEVRTAQGRTVAASEVLWMRSREVWVHAVDLDSGVEFADLPVAFNSALVDDVLALLGRRDQVPEATLEATDVDLRREAGRTVIRGPVSALAAWLTRADSSGLEGDPPPVSRWL